MTTPSQESSTRTLVILGAFLLTLFVSTDAILRHSDVFWLSSIRGASTDRSSPLYVDALLHTWPRAEKRVVFLGSSVVATDLDEVSLSSGLALDEANVGTLWMPDASAVEMAMLTPSLVALRPDVVVYLVTIWNFFDDDELGKLRFYDPRVSASLFRADEFISDISSHASGLLAWQHVVIRHREYLRRSLLVPLLERLGETPRERRRQQTLQRMVEQDRVIERRNRRLIADADDFVCGGLRTRALSLMGEQLEKNGIEFVIVRTPVKGPWDHHPEVRRRIDDCVSEQAAQGGFDYVATGDLPRFSPEEFRDPLHMTPAGRAKFTQALVAPITPVLQRPSADPS